MKILPKIKSISKVRLADKTQVKINEDVTLIYNNTSKSDDSILQDLIECNAFATTLLYLNENYTLDITKNDLINESNVLDFYSDCEELLKENISVVEEKGVLLTNINGYNIYEGAGYILRGNGAKKLKESFNKLYLEDITLDMLKNNEYSEQIENQVICPNCNSMIEKDENTFEDEEEQIENYSTLDNPYNERVYYINVDKIKCPYCNHEDLPGDFYSAFTDDLMTVTNREELIPGINKTFDLEESIEEAEGTQCSDIAGKVDQDMNGKTTNKKKYYDLLLSDDSDLTESIEILNKGFLRNSNGQYQRGNYILVKEGDTYLAIHKNKLK